MILVLLGTQDNSFHRLLEKIEELIEKEVIKDEVIVQAGHTKYKTDKMKVFDLMPIEQLYDYEEQADLVITHGGVGSIVSSIKRNKKVIAVPRKHQYKEHINDHQKEIVELFNKKRYIIGINDIEELQDALEKVENFIPEKYQSNNSKILNIIEEFIEKV